MFCWSSPLCTSVSTFQVTYSSKHNRHSVPQPMVQAHPRSCLCTVTTTASNVLESTNASTFWAHLHKEHNTSSPCRQTKCRLNRALVSYIRWHHLGTTVGKSATALSACAASRAQSIDLSSVPKPTRTSNTFCTLSPCASKSNALSSMLSKPISTRVWVFIVKTTGYKSYVTVTSQ